MLRLQKGLGSARDPENVVSYQGADPESRERMLSATARINIPYVFCPHFSGLEQTAEMLLGQGDVLAGSYQVVDPIGSGSFANVYHAKALSSDERPVCLKVLRNSKECFDMGLSEIRALLSIQANDPFCQHQLLRLLDYFYVREHLVIVTEMLNVSLFAHYADLKSRGELQAYYNAQTIGMLSVQILDALAFLHMVGITHSDVKPPNICVASAQHRQFKLIDLGASLLALDSHTSYVQSRWYRAPEVMLGCQWDELVDVWSFGCVLAELVLQAPIFCFDSVELVLGAHIATRGAFPKWMTQAHSSAKKLLSTSGSAYEVDPKRQPPGVYMIHAEPDVKLRSLLASMLDVSLFTSWPGAVEQFISFTEALLELDPRIRASAASALTHQFVQASQAYT